MVIGAAASSHAAENMEKQLEEFLEKTAQAASAASDEQAYDPSVAMEFSSHSESNHSGEESGSETDHSGHSSHARSPSTDKDHSKEPSGVVQCIKNRLIVCVFYFG